MTKTTLATAERRIFSGLQIREVETTDSLSMLSGIAVPYREQTDIGWFLEDFEPGAFAKSIREAALGLPLLVFHDTSDFPIGNSTEWIESDTALRGVWKLDRENPRALMAARQAKDKLLNYMSVRFVPVRSEWTTVEDFAPDLGAAHKDSVTRIEARLLETSLVSTPAYAGAKVEWVRSHERTLAREARGAELAGWQAYVEKMRNQA